MLAIWTRGKRESPFEPVHGMLSPKGMDERHAFVGFVDLEIFGTVGNRFPGRQSREQSMLSFVTGIQQIEEWSLL